MSNDEFSNMNKDMENFRRKHMMLLEKYQQKHLVSARRIVEKRKDGSMTSCLDVTQIMKDYDESFDKIYREINVSHDDKITPKYIDVSYLDEIRIGLRLMKQELPELLSQKNFTIPHRFSKYMKAKNNDAIVGNLNLIIDLKKQEITTLFSFLHSLYKELPSIIKGKGGENSVDE